jgi:peptide/nickel transport system substrate-binding protein
VRHLLRRSAVRRIGVLAIGAALVAAACGGDSDGGGAADEPAAGTGATAQSGTPADSAAGTGGTLRIAMTAANIPIPDQFVTEGGEGVRFVGVNVYDRLLNWDTQQADHPPMPIPGLAESYTVGDDQLTWTFTLRPGVTFHDGTPVDAEAIKFSFDRVLDKDFEHYSADQAGLGSATIAQIASYRIVDDSTFEIVTKKPWSFLAYDVAQITIVSPTAVQTYGNEEYAQHAVGAGPFKIDRYVEGEVMELVPFEDYWAGRPKLDRIVLYPRPEPASRLSGLQAGEVDWAEIPPPDALAQLEGQGFQVVMGSYPHAIVYLLNNYRAPFDDVRVRQAVGYGIDREGMMALITDVGIPADQYFYEGHPWRDETFEGYAYDPERARQLLADAGYADGLTIRVAHPASGSGNMFPGVMNEKFQQDMAAIGVDVELFPMEWTALLTVYRAGFASPDGDKYDAMYFSPNTQAPMFAFASYLTERIPPAGCCNAMGYSNPEADAIMDEAAATFDPDAQAELLRQFHGTWIREAPSVPVAHDLNLRVMSPKVHGWIQPQSWWGDFTSVWVEE